MFVTGADVGNGARGEDKDPEAMMDSAAGQRVIRTTGFWEVLPYMGQKGMGTRLGKRTRVHDRGELDAERVKKRPWVFGEI